MMIKFLRIRILIWICLLSTFIWWGSKSIIRYWNQPLTTDVVYTFGENGIQFPLMTFCDHDFVSKNKILQANFFQKELFQESIFTFYPLSDYFYKGDRYFFLLLSFDLLLPRTII